MLLAVDIGNTNTKFAVFDGETLISKTSIPTSRDSSTEDLTGVLRSRIEHTFDSAIVCSVVPELNEKLAEAVNAVFGADCRIVQNHDNFGIEIRYEPLEDAGSDRLVNVYSAIEKYGPPLIVCSFGTATTMDFVSEDRVLVGGLIAPGVRTMTKAINLTTSRLPEVQIEFPEKILQNRTVKCLQSGIVVGYIEMVDGLLRRIKNETNVDAKIISTGGNAQLVAENSAHKMNVEADLLLNGLAKLTQR